ncbi:MAG: glycogen-binding domain-containing protein [Sedimentisphaerales bacterium]|nr:glycogen-binding domain-containing protein [Sedimentisphaerales bacterium]
MISQVNKKGTIRFVYSPDGPVTQVCLAGSFNNWQPASMKKQKNGLYALELKMSKGQHEYKFVVDGVWQSDPENADTVQNALGTVNSVVIVG